MSPADADVLRADDLSLARAGERVVDGVSVRVPAGGALAVMGGTGSGKSSLAAALAGDDDPTLQVVGGRAEVHGVDLRRGGRKLRIRRYLTGYLPQGAGAALPARLTVSEVISEPITSRDRRVNQRALALRVASLLDELQLPIGAAAKYPYELSSGMRQRVALARALVLDPKLFVGDEPYGYLDVEVRLAARDALLRRRAEAGMAVVLVTNDETTIAELDADVLVLQAGRVVASGRGTAGLLWTPDADGRAAR
ncbi:ATP-binding cassette domain-containing protein [Microbacterium telephonicum]|uniref:Peptide/nickel transport system ATP-binding protein n=1 Tax=Microbacterium telephonicum TaxID=1714841 RepID=A0A498C9C4_9MICO|nr:ATP-binding cassette domain-containing protein [Microbacterium telephonicum]RLK49490.1 peptide/nickel transport system ATP-binding protein [Microbacterium telephonicum]